MKKFRLFSLSLLILPMMVLAQEKAEVSIKITKEGTVVKDTMYHFDDLEKAKHALNMMDILSSEDIDLTKMKVVHLKDMEKENMHMHEGEHSQKGGYSYKMMISEEGEIHEMHGDKMKWVTADSDGENVFINEEDGKIEVIIKKVKEGENGEKVNIHKEIIIIDDEGIKGEGNWTAKEGKDGETIYVSEDGKKMKIKKKILSESDEDVVWTLKEGEDKEEVEVIVIKKKLSEEDEEKMEVEVTIDDSKKDVERKMGKKKKNR